MGPIVVVQAVNKVTTMASRAIEKCMSFSGEGGRQVLKGKSASSSDFTQPVRIFMG
jgi:hypothetical protein